MKEISTSITIEATAEKVWSYFSDFSEYPWWNPFISNIEGEVAEGNRIAVTMNPPDANPMVFKPKILVYEEEKEVSWLGHVLFPGIFDGQHIFTIKENYDGTVTFVQREVFRGLLVPLFSNMLDNNTRQGFELMNERLKELCEKE